VGSPSSVRIRTEITLICEGTCSCAAVVWEAAWLEVVARVRVPPVAVAAFGEPGALLAAAEPAQASPSRMEMKVK